MRADQEAVIDLMNTKTELNKVNLDLRKVLKRIQELATDTPTPEDMEKNLDLIYRECEAALINERP